MDETKTRIFFFRKKDNLDQIVKYSYSALSLDEINQGIKDAEDELNKSYSNKRLHLLQLLSVEETLVELLECKFTLLYQKKLGNNIGAHTAWYLLAKTYKKMIYENDGNINDKNEFFIDALRKLIMEIDEKK
ncbi:MAG: hypothetical protein LC122_11930 [Chitinophagales bacterium]|nr:hypothetical protein [Chitinophagales bacterium]